MWQFLYDEEIQDEWPNYMGVLTDNDHVLFYHGQTVSDDREQMSIYTSLTDMFVRGTPVTTFSWTAENEESFLNYLNSFDGWSELLTNIDGFNPEKNYENSHTQPY